MQNKRIHILQWAMLIGALAYSLVFVFVGFGNKMDPFFWFNKYQELDSGWMTCGTVLFGHLWLKLTGPAILSLRLLSWICCAIAIALPFVCLLPREQQQKNLHWLAITYLLMAYGTFQEFSTGTLSVLLFSLLTVLWVRYLQGKTAIWPTALVLGLSILARFPNILCIPILLISLILIGWQQKLSWKRILCDAGFLVLIALSVEAIGWCIWHLTSTQDLAAPTGNHTLKKMILFFWEKGTKFGIQIFAALATLATFAFCRKKSKVLTVVATILAAIAMLAYLCFYQPHHVWYNQETHSCAAAVVISLTLWYIFTKRSWPLFSCLLLYFVLPMGSDTAWLKLFPGILCLLPWVASEHQLARPALPAIFVLALFTSWQCTTNAIGNRNLCKCDTWAQEPLMQGIRIQQNQDKRLQQIKLDYDHFSQQGVVYVVGEDIHLMRALTGAPRPYKNEFWSNIYDKVYTRWYRELVQESHPIIICSYTPSFILDKKKQKVKDSLLEHMLLDEEGYRAIDRSNYRYMIYLPTSSQTQKSH